MLRSTPILRALAGALLILLAARVEAASAPPPLKAYGELPEIEAGAISPSGARIAVVGIVHGARQLILLDSGLSPLRAVTMGDVKLRGISWVGDDAVLMTTSETHKLGVEFNIEQYEAFAATVIPVDRTKEVRVVFSKSAEIVNGVFGNYGIRQIDGEWFGYFGGVAAPRDGAGNRYLEHSRPALFAVRLSDNSARRIAEPAREGTWRDWLIDAGGKVAATLDMMRDSGAWNLTGPTGQTIASGVEATGDAGLLVLGRDGSSAIYWAQDQDGIARWYEVPLDGSAPPHEILAGENVSLIFSNPANGRMIGYQPGGEGRAPVFFDPHNQALADKVTKAFKNRDATFAAFNPGLAQLLVHTSGNGDSGTWYMVDTGKLHADTLGVERPEIGPEAVGPVSSFAYRAADGLDLDGVLTLPPGKEARNLPVVVLPHGGPAAYDEVQFDWWAQAFASRGYAVFQPNFRGSTNRDDAFRHAGDGQWGRRMQSDISDGLAALAGKGIVDPARACIMGGSYGGYAALAGVTLQHGLYRCAVSVAGVADVSLLYRTENTENGQSKVEKRALLAELGPPSSFEDISPRHFAGKADAPILLIHGRDDTVVPFEQSEKMADALKDAHKPYDLVDLGNEDHWLSRSETREKMLEAAMAFVEKYDPPD